MRYADRAILIISTNEAESVYDPELGRLIDSEIKQKELPCCISHQSLELGTKLNENLTVNTLIVRFRHKIPKVDKLMVKNRLYKVITRRHNTLYVEEVVNGANHTSQRE